MRTKLYIIVIAALFLLVFCQKKADMTKLTFIKTELGGCNLTPSVQNNEDIVHNDSVDISIKNDSMNIFVGLNYFCCAPFITDCYIKSDSIIISIKDTCLNPNSCYCRCSCYYTFNFKFLQSSINNYNYKILLFDPREIGSKLIKAGLIKAK